MRKKREYRKNFLIISCFCKYSCRKIITCLYLPAIKHIQGTKNPLCPGNWSWGETWLTHSCGSRTGGQILFLCHISLDRSGRR